MKKLLASILTVTVLAGTTLCIAGEMLYQTDPRLVSYFAKAKANRASLVAFLHKMPKGGDLHNHPTGAVYAESTIRIAQDLGLYFDRTTRSLTARQPSGPFYRPEEFTENYWKQGELLEAFSLRNLDRSAENGHDRFFRAFDRFGAVYPSDLPVYREIMRRALNQEISYLELMTIPTADPDWRDLVEQARLDAVAEFAAKGLNRELEVRFIYPLVRVSHSAGKKQSPCENMGIVV